MSPLRHESRNQIAAPPSGGRRTRDRGRRNRCHLQVERFEGRRLLTTITVTGVGDTVANDGVVTLREAILAANTNAAVGDAKAGTAGLDTIAFDIPGAGVHTISLTSPLPTITDPIVIDGYTQPGSHPNTNPLDKGDNALPLIELDGSGAGNNGVSGLHIDAGGSTVRGLVIDRFSAYGIWLTGTGSDHIEGNFIGTDPTGLIARGNGDGIRTETEVGDVTIGGPDPAQRNILAGNFGNGEIESRGDRAIIQGNYVGFGADGDTMLGTANRITLIGSSSTVGGATAGEGNVIASSAAIALGFENAGGSGRTYHDGLVQGNRIGVSAAGTVVSSFYASEARIDVSAWTNLTIGGTATGAGNILGGIDLNDSTGVLIQGNFIGTDPTGALNLAGLGYYGVDVGGTYGSHDNTIGGPAAGAGNLIANHGGGVYVEARSDSTAILSNRILASNYTAIQLANPIDAPGGNNLQAAPVLTSVSKSGGHTIVGATIDSAPDTAYTVQLFSSSTCCFDGHGPGEVLLKTMQTTPSDASGHVAFSIDVPMDVPDGRFLSATATDPAGNTSQFSLDRVVGHLIVTNANDSGPGSLRQAITCANHILGTDTIIFDIPGSGVHTIALATALPAITDPVVIDGYTQPGASPNTQATGDDAVLLIELDGVSAANATGLGGVEGLDISAGNSIVRGLVIHSFYSDGILLHKSGGDLIEGNFIGTNATASAASGSYVNGVTIDQTSDNTIGGTTPAARNIIGGAIGILGGSNLVEGNLIGTTATGDYLGHDGGGVSIDDDSSGNTIGGSAAGAGNTIAYSGGAGVSVGERDQGTIIRSNIIAHNRWGVLVYDKAQGTTILSNSISSSLFLGIDLGKDDVTPNDAGDADIGANGLQNYPVITSAVTIGSQTTIVGSLNSTPKATFHLEFFGNDAAGFKGHGEGQTLLGSKDVTTDANGNYSFTLPFDGSPKFVTATATDAAGNTSEFSQALATTATDGGADLSVKVTAATYPVTLGDGNLTYTVTVTNHSTDTVKGVVLSDTLPGNSTFFAAVPAPTAQDGGKLTFDLGDLAGGATRTVAIAVTPTAAGTFTDRADVSAPNGPADPDTANNSDSAIAVVNPAPAADVGIELTTSADTVNVGEKLTYTIRATNHGPSATAAVIVDTLPAGVTFVSASGAVKPDQGKLTFYLSVSAFAGGDSTTVTIVVKPTAAGTLTDSATISGGEADPDTSNNSASRDVIVQATTVQPTPEADVSVAVAASPDPPTLGQGNLTYTVTVTNHGPDTAKGVVLIDTLPEASTFVSASPPPTAQAGGKLTLDLGDLADGAKMIITIVAKPTAAGQLTDSATVTGSVADPDATNNSASRDTTVKAPPPKVPGLAVIIAPDQDKVTVGQELGYTITVSNDGAAGATDVALTDSIPPGAEFVRATGDIAPVDGVLTFHLGDLASGAKVALKVVVRPTRVGSLTTMAHVAADQPGSDTGSDSATITIQVVPPILRPDPPIVTPPGGIPGATPSVEDGPRVVRLRRFGFHSQPTWLVLTFNGPLDPARATDRASYSITGPGVGRRPDPFAPRRVPIRSVVYNPNTDTVMLHTRRRLDLHRPYRLVVAGTGARGMADPSGTMIDGDGDGRPGGDDIVRVIDRILAGKADDAGPLFGSKFPIFKPATADRGSGPSRA